MSEFRDRMKRARRFALYLVLRPPIEVFRRLPPRLSGTLGAALGVLARYLFPREIRRGLANIGQVFPGAGEAVGKRILAASLRHLGRSMGEFFSYTARPPEAIKGRVGYRGLEDVKDAVARGKGVIILSGHFGNWETAAAATARELPGLAVVARELYDINLSRLIERMRAHFGTLTFDNRDGAAIYRHLRRGGVLVTLVDQESRKVANVPAPIFGIPALAPSGSILMASRAGAALFSVFAVPADGGCTLVFEEMDAPVEGAPPEETLVKFNSRLEKMVREWPDQWVWLHNRWKREASPEQEGAGRSVGAAAVLLALLLASCGGGVPEQSAGVGEGSGESLRSLMRGAKLVQVYQGRVEAEISAAEAVNSVDGRWLEGRGVSVIYHQAGGKRAVLRASSARYDSLRKVMEASGTVRVEAEGLVLETSQLVWDAGKSRITSDAFVKVTRGENVLTGKGLDADTEMENVVIKEDVRILASEPKDLAPALDRGRGDAEKQGRE